VVLGACDDQSSQCACTEEFRTYPVTVVDEAGDVATDVVLNRTNLRTAQVFEPTWLGQHVPGTYLVADDGLVYEFSIDGDSVRVDGQQGVAAFTAFFEFAVTGPCRCHVEKLSGPDTVVIRE
jgi:hypothetical protein